MCQVLAASRSVYYGWLSREQQPTNRQKPRELLAQLVADAAFIACKKRSRSPLQVLDLKEQGHYYDRKTVAPSMKRQQLRAWPAKNFKATTNLKHNLPVAPNLF